MGDRCYPSLRDLPEPVGAALIMVAPAQTEAVVRDAAAAGIKQVWMQQGAESAAAVKFCQENGISEVHGECILMLRAAAEVLPQAAPLGVGDAGQAAEVAHGARHREGQRPANRCVDRDGGSIASQLQPGPDPPLDWPGGTPAAPSPCRPAPAPGCRSWCARRLTRGRAFSR